MLRVIAMSALVFAASLAHAADGILSMNLLLSSTDWRMELESSPSRVTGSIDHGGSPFVDLKLTEKGWQGRLGDSQVASTSVKDKGNGKFEVRISTLPSGIFDFTYRVESNGNVSISGMGPQGNLNSAGLKKNGRELYVQTGSLNLAVSAASGDANRYEGSATLTSHHGFDSGHASLNAQGRLAPTVLKNDPALYTLIYVLPFSH